MVIVNNIELILSLTVNILLVCSWLIHRLGKVNKRKWVEKFLGAEVATIYFPSRNANRQMPVIATEDFYAAYSLAEFFRSHGLKIDLKHIPPDSRMNFQAGDVVICGPKTSATIQQFLEEDPYYRFFEDQNGQWKFRDQSTNNELISPSDKIPSESKDIAYLGRLRFQRDISKKFILLAGIHAIGSYGVVHFLCQIKNMIRLEREIKGDCFSTIILSEYETHPLQIVSSEIFMPIKRH